MSTYKNLPKVELHLHLDCSLSYDIVHQLNPSIDFKAYTESFIAPPKCINLADYISRALKGFELMQTKEQMRLVTLDLFRQLQAEQVIYAEIRFAPLQHIFKGLKAAEVVRAVDDAVNEAKTLTGIEAGIILCTLRHYSEAQSLQTVHLFKEFKDSNVVGFDLAADEAGFPITSHIKTFQFANENGINCTAHAGEAKGAESVWETLQMLRPKRIGHGVRSIEDVELLTYLKENKIHLEICPTSNIQTNVFDRMENHSIDQIYKSGISMSINTDARTISNVSLTDEYETLARVFNWTKKHFLNCNLQAIDHSFLSIEKKEKLKTVLINGYS